VAVDGAVPEKLLLGHSEENDAIKKETATRHGTSREGK
jgi:hypothetical protein